MGFIESPFFKYIFNFLNTTFKKRVETRKQYRMIKNVINNDLCFHFAISITNRMRSSIFLKFFIVVKFIFLRPVVPDTDKR